MTALQGRKGALKELDRAIDWFHSHYGSDLPAFFAATAEQPDRRAKPAAPSPKSMAAGSGTKILHKKT